MVEVDRLVNAAGLVTLGKQRLCIDQQLAGRRVILRVEARLVHVLADGFLVRTLPSPIPTEARARLQGARLATTDLPAPAGLTVVERKVSRGIIQVAGQKLRVGWITQQDDDIGKVTQNAHSFTTIRDRVGSTERRTWPIVFEWILF